MRLASATCSCCAVVFGSRDMSQIHRERVPRVVETYYNRRKAICQMFSARSSSLHRTNSILCSSKASAGAYFADQTKFSTFLRNLTCQFLEISPEPLKDIVWKKAKMMVKERLIALGHDVVTWFLVAVLVFSFVTDIFMAVSANRELLVPLGLFIGVMMADFLEESCHQFFESTEQRGSDIQIWGIGLLFVAIRFVFISFRIRGWMLLSHIANGALMQILWLANEQQESLQDPERGNECSAAPA